MNDPLGVKVGTCGPHVRTGLGVDGSPEHCGRLGQSSLPFQSLPFQSLAAYSGAVGLSRHSRVRKHTASVECVETWPALQ
jgi:hypothetical protein